MSIQPNSLGRGCAAAYSEPMSERQVAFIEKLEDAVYHYNCRKPHPGTSRLDEIVYRSSDRDHDKLHHVFRWAPESRATYQHVFQFGFTTPSEQDNDDRLYCNLYHYIHQAAGRPLQDRSKSYTYISTTLNTGWQPNIDQGTTGIQYRFEIYAPGGIWIAQTLGDLYHEDLCSQDEVTFVMEIAPQYIRSVQRFRVDPNPDTSRFSRLVRADSEIIINGNFRPHPTMLIHIQNPVYYCLIQEEDGRRRRAALNRRFYYPSHNNEKEGQESTDFNVIDWYAREVAKVRTYINAAFRAYSKNEAYIFMNNEYLLLNYAPLTTDDKVVNGPLLIRDGFPSLVGTAFAEWGIDCAFASHDGTEAFIFSGNLCAYIDYASGTTDDKIIKGPMTITAMFPFFKGTVFESGIDAAFEAQTKYEAYLFKGNQYALINYNSPKLIAIRPITHGFRSLRDTIFKSGIDAAFASHKSKEAYLFKGDSYALLEFDPESSDDRIIGGVKKILPNWPSLQEILPRKNGALDVDYNHITTGPAPSGHHEL